MMAIREPTKRMIDQLLRFSPIFSRIYARLVTKSTANRQLSGNRAQMNATFRHGNTSPQPNTIKIPKLYDNNAIVLIIPRILGSLQAQKM